MSLDLRNLIINFKRWSQERKIYLLFLSYSSNQSFSPFSFAPHLLRSDLSPFTQNDKNDPEAGELHPDARRKPTPDFEGETNPATGEIGGPKKDPLSWEREWTYGGRATDF